MTNTKSKTEDEDSDSDKFCLFFGSSPAECGQKLSTANAELILHGKITTGFHEAIIFLDEILNSSTHPYDMIFWLRKLKEQLGEEDTPEIWREWYIWLGEKTDLLENVAENPTNTEFRGFVQNFLTAWFQLIAEETNN